MRIRFLNWVMTLAICAGLAAPRGSAQQAETMMPEQSAAKAKQVLKQLISAMGGDAYLQTRETDCTGRLAQFEHNGDLSGYTNFRDYWHLPDKNRTEYEVKGAKGGLLGVLIGSIPFKGGTIIEMYNGDDGWTMDRSGVSEQSAVNIADFKEQTKRDIDNVLRFRLKEEGMLFRYGGMDLVDMKPVEWVELVDRDDRTFRYAVLQSSHLLARSIVITRDETTRERTEEITSYGNYHMQGQVMAPLQVERKRDGRRLFQAFFDACSFDQHFPPDFFTKASLEKKYSESFSKKDREKAAKQREKEERDN
ncbi:MAG TPA: hypothetical protein VNK47_09355 [Candidatus Dormibacteraeota bacterium]|nr:hypothetical protein [Candidatus Dormibacteraeota bacterium]